MLLVGLVHRPHGLSGEVSVEPTTAFPERFQPGSRLFWRRGDRDRELVLATARPHGGRWLLRFEGVGGLEAARELAGGELGVPDDEAVRAPDGYYYSHRIEGWSCENGGGRRLGTVAGLEVSVAGPLLTVRTPGGKPVLVPFVAGIVVEMDEAGRRVILDPPEGLFEL
jgi:16S rRNA processing protein RimM